MKPLNVKVTKDDSAKASNPAKTALSRKELKVIVAALSLSNSLARSLNEENPRKYGKESLDNVDELKKKIEFLIVEGDTQHINTNNIH